MNNSEGRSPPFQICYLTMMSLFWECSGCHYFENVQVPGDFVSCSSLWILKFLNVRTASEPHGFFFRVLAWIPIQSCLRISVKNIVSCSQCDSRFCFGEDCFMLSVWFWVLLWKAVEDCNCGFVFRHTCPTAVSAGATAHQQCAHKLAGATWPWPWLHPGIPCLSQRCPQGHAEGQREDKGTVGRCGRQPGEWSVLSLNFAAVLFGLNKMYLMYDSALTTKCIS